MGFFIIFIWFSQLQLVTSQPCPNDCNSHGRCRNPGQVCDCFKGFDGPDCSLYECPSSVAWVDIATGVDKGHNLAECSNKGVCNRFAGTCTCANGFEGAACQRLSCPSNCNSVGVCLSMNSYARTKDPGSGTVYKFENIWNANKTHGCKCDRGFSGSDCSVRKCPTGDDPLTGNGAVSTTENPSQLNTIQRINCLGGSGTFTLAFRGETTKPIPYNADEVTITTYLEALTTIKSGGVQVILYGLQACLDSGQSYFQVEFLQDFGTLPLLVPGFKNMGTSALMSVSIFQAGDKEDKDCAGRGLCDTTSGVCSCDIDYDTSNGYALAGTRGDCGYYTSSTAVTTCPGIISCSGHGVCKGSPTYVCECSTGWTGADCSLRLCPSSASWFSYPSANDEAHLYEQAECSHAGLCDRTTGICACDRNFEGAACEFMSCPGDATPCNGQGQCLDMNSLANLATIEGNLAGYTYGTIANDPLTWDAYKIKGCVCDTGFTGYDCSLFACPYGDDPSTQGQLDEIQTFTCTDPDLTGAVTFTFRSQSSDAISSIATTTEIETALGLVSSVGKVEVTIPTGSTDALCSTVGNSLEIRFLQTHGPLPLLTVTPSNINLILNIVETVQGNKEFIECSGRGICETLTGVCSCFAGYGSSNGMGAPGIIGDCGNILKHSP